MRIVIGLLGTILSILLIVYREPVKHFTGSIGFAEKYLGQGGTYTLFIIVGILMFMFSLMYMTDSFDVVFGTVGMDFFRSVK